LTGVKTCIDLTYTILWIKVSFNTVLFNRMHGTYLIKMYIGLHLKYPLFFTYFYRTWITSTDFEKYSNHILRNPSIGSRVVLCGRTDWQTGRQIWRS